MRKNKGFKETRFTADVLRESVEKLRSMNPDSGKDFKFITLKVSHEDETWSYDTLDEFLADYRASKLKASLSLMCGKYLLAAETYAGM